MLLNNTNLFIILNFILIMKFNKLLPELTVSNLKNSLHFYIDILGFKIEYERPNFAFVSYQGSQLMLDANNTNPDSPWYTGKLEYPFGRGIHFQFEVDDIQPLLNNIKKHNYPLKQEPKIHEYRKDNQTLKFKGFLVQDPDGYLLMFNQDLD